MDGTPLIFQKVYTECQVLGTVIFSFLKTEIEQRIAADPDPFKELIMEETYTKYSTIFGDRLALIVTGGAAVPQVHHSIHKTNVSSIYLLSCVSASSAKSMKVMELQKQEV